MKRIKCTMIWRWKLCQCFKRVTMRCNGTKCAPTQLPMSSAWRPRGQMTGLQLPVRKSSWYPRGHCLETHRNDPGMLTQSLATPQLCVPRWHSSSSTINRKTSATVVRDLVSIRHIRLQFPFYQQSLRHVNGNILKKWFSFLSTLFFQHQCITSFTTNVTKNIKMMHWLGETWLISATIQLIQINNMITKTTFFLCLLSLHLPHSTFSSFKNKKGKMHRICYFDIHFWHYNFKMNVNLH